MERHGHWTFYQGAAKHGRVACPLGFQHFTRTVATRLKDWRFDILDDLEVIS
jgi:hypothetical protein